MACITGSSDHISLAAGSTQRHTLDVPLYPTQSSSYFCFILRDCPLLPNLSNICPVLQTRDGGDEK
ncbi:hypothetical protein FH972_023098 [Carpinus fangiana]|uniref:Uncharacterized protein n=1 Tax=Carpinus fangiana TaxID=176857 RepID=A0A5N6KU63_9ROSI|nr:hypothetical protein FH972_023098 [Carpinus fangiana]